MCRAGAVAMLKAFVLAAVLCEVPKDNSSQVYRVDPRHGNSTRSHPPKMCFSGQLIVVPAAHGRVVSRKLPFLWSPVATEDVLFFRFRLPGAPGFIRILQMLSEEVPWVPRLRTQHRIE